MNAIKKLRDAFNWLNEQPNQQYTLTDLAVKLSDGKVGLDCSGPYTRAGRFGERIITLSGSSLSIAFAVSAAAATPVALTPLPLLFFAMAAATGMTASKCGGFFAAIVAEVAVRFGVGATRLLDKKYNGAEF